jgi:exopolysaccharide production protein ExoY
MIATVLVTLFIGIVVRLLADEVKAWSGWSHQMLRRRAVAMLPVQCRERYDEEWESGLEEIPGEILKVIYSLGLLRAAAGIRKAASKSAVRSEMLVVLATESWQYRYVKRAMDVTLSPIMIVILAPQMLLIAAAIGLTSKGPVLYRSSRIGRNGRLFRVWSFRCMCPDPAQRERITPGGGIVRRWSLTPVGGFLRRWGLDELPQLLNVLVGEMSLIGPRPIIEAEMPLYGRFISHYLKATPGLLGLGQINSRSHLDYEKRAKMNAEYVEKWSLLNDLIILLLTIPAAFGQIGRNLKAS